MPASSSVRKAYFEWLERFDATALEVDSAIARSGRYVAPIGAKHRTVEIVHTTDDHHAAYALAVNGDPIDCDNPCYAPGYALFLAYFLANGIPEGSCVTSGIRREVATLEDAIARRTSSPSV